jgi:pimeloyl-ACP methyl ester carboxylesterase
LPPDPRRGAGVRHTLFSALLLPLLAWLVLCARMAFQQRELIYFGGATRVAASATNFSLPREAGVVLRGWRVNPEAADAVLYFGGNAEEVGGMRRSLQDWLPRRTSYLLAYRGYGASDGEPAQDLLFADAVALYDAVAARHPGGRIAVIGRSLGSGVAAYLAAQRPVEKLVLVTPFDSLVAVAGAHFPWLPTTLLVSERFESTHWLQHYRGPLLVIRAGRDRIVPAANTDRLIAALPQVPQVLLLPDADHNAVLETPSEAHMLSRFLAAEGTESTAP